MKKILLIGEEKRRNVFHNELIKSGKFEIDFSDGDEEEDFADYDTLFDLNFDDDPENYHIYTELKNKIVFLSTVKRTLAESNFEDPNKVKCHLFGLNCIPKFVENTYWEVSLFRGHELDILQGFLKEVNKSFLLVDDRVGMYRPISKFVFFNELMKSVESGNIQNYSEKITLLPELSKIDEYGITEIFETLISIYEDNQELKYLPCSLLKKKYLRNHPFIRK